VKQKELEKEKKMHQRLMMTSYHSLSGLSFFVSEPPGLGRPHRAQESPGGNLIKLFSFVAYDEAK